LARGEKTGAVPFFGVRKRGLSPFLRQQTGADGRLIQADDHDPLVARALARHQRDVTPRDAQALREWEAMRTAAE